MRERRQPTRRPPRARARDLAGEHESERFEQARARTRPATPTTSASAEYDLQSSRTRERVSSRSCRPPGGRGRARRAAPSTVGRSARAPCRTRAAGATITRAPASRARQHRSMSSAPGNGRRVEAAELVEQVGAHEHRRVRDVEDVAHAVVLLLVDLVGLDARERDAVVVDRHARPRGGCRDGRGRRASGRRCPAFDRYASSTSSRTASGSSTTSSWQKSRKTAPSTDVERLVGRRREPARRPRAAPHEGAREGAGDPVGRVLGGPVVEDEDRQRRIVLGAEGRQALLEPGPGVVRDHDRDHGRDGRGRFGLVVTLEQLGADRVGVDRLHEAGRG